jgi:hypothetical protein
MEQSSYVPGKYKVFTCWSCRIGGVKDHTMKQAYDGRLVIGASVPIRHQEKTH